MRSLNKIGAVYFAPPCIFPCSKMLTLGDCGKLTSCNKSQEIDMHLRSHKHFDNSCLYAVCYSLISACRLHYSAFVCDIVLHRLLLLHLLLLKSTRSIISTTTITTKSSMSIISFRFVSKH